MEHYDAYQSLTSIFFKPFCLTFVFGISKIIYYPVEFQDIEYRLQVHYKSCSL